MSAEGYQLDVKRFHGWHQVMTLFDRAVQWLIESLE